MITEFKDFNELSALFLCRQLYTFQSRRVLSAGEILELNRRFSKGYSIVVQDPKHKKKHEELLKFT